MIRSLASTPRMLSLVLGAVLALSSTPAFGIAPNARQQSERLLAEGDTALAKERWDEAISKYRASYYGLPPEDHASYLGSLPVRKAMRAYAERVAQEQDPAKRRSLLERQRVLLEEFLDAVAAKPGASDEVGPDVIAELEETRRSIDAALAPPKGDDPEPTEDVGPPTDSTDPSLDTDDGPVDAGATTDDPAPRRDWLGLGLVIGGSTLLAGGLGLAAFALATRSEARQFADNGGPEYAEGTDLRESYLSGEDTRTRPHLIAGSVLAGVGLATAIGGVVHVVLHRRRASARPTALRVAPVLSPTTAGITLLRRF